MSETIILSIADLVLLCVKNNVSLENLICHILPDGDYKIEMPDGGMFKFQRYNGQIKQGA